MKVAIEGCCHGCLDQIYKRLNKKKVELLIICGDFQSIRNKADLQSMSVPDKYKSMGDFQDYYTLKKKAPIMTIFIGGNHESSNYLEELKFGGFVAPNIFYMGRSSVIWYKGLRIGGISGVYWLPDFLKLRPNNYQFPLQRSNIRSIYHYSMEDYIKLKLLNVSPKMIMLSHDWPEGIYNYGNKDRLLEKKPFFKSDIKKGELGSPFNMNLLKKIQPSYWFSAHLHVKFTAMLKWGDDKANEKKRIINEDEVTLESKKVKVDQKNDDEIELDISLDDKKNEDEIELEISVDAKDKNQDEIELDICCDDTTNTDEIGKDSNEDTTTPIEPTISNGTTKFLALDKCLPRREYLEIMDIELTDKDHISTKFKNEPLFYDEEYISSHKVINKYKHKLENISIDELNNENSELFKEFQSLKEFYLKEYKNLDRKSYRSLFNIHIKGFVQTALPNEKIGELKVNPQTTSFISKFE